MDQGTAPDSARWSLRSRGPAHAVSHRCLDVQRSAGPRRVWGRLVGVDPLHPDAVGWYRGALGERRVGRILDELGREWRVLHAVPHGDGDSDIDHLVIGPPGVFTITTTNQSGRRVVVDDGALFADGQRTAALVSAEDGARAASRSLSRATGTAVLAEAIVVTVDARSFVSEGTGTPVAVIPAGRLVRHLRDLPAAFGPDLVASVTRAAEEWTTWRPFGSDNGHADPDDDFERLHAEVTAARARRRLWQLGGVGAVTASMVAILSGVFF